MGNLYSKKPKPSKGPDITDVDRAILSLKTQRKKLEDQEKMLNMRLARHTEVARQLAKEGHRDRALLVLRKKKLSEKQLIQLHGLIINVEEMLSNIETTKKQTAIFAALQNGNDALKQLQAQIKLEDVQQLLDDTAEAKRYQEELASLLGQQLTDMDDLEVEAELEALEGLVHDEERLAMPSAPTTKVSEASKFPEQSPRATEGEAEEEPKRTAEREPMMAS